MTGPPIARGTVVLQDDRVVAVGAGVAVPPGATVIDATGLVVTPGLIASETALGVVEIELEREANDERPRGRLVRPVRAALRAWDALNPESAAVPVTRLEGFTTAVTRLRGGLVSGQAAAFDLHGLTPQANALRAPVAVHAALGLAGAREADGSRAVALAELRRVLDDTRYYARNRAAFEARRLRDLAAPLPDLQALVPVVEGRVPLVVRVNRAADILAVLHFAQEQRVRLVLDGAAEGWRVAEAIARARVPVLVEVDHNLPTSFDSLGGRYDNAARLHRAGVVIALSANGAAHDARSLRQLAGIAAAWGLPRPAALAALTTGPAAVYDLPDRGALRPGARANVVVWSGDPLELSTRVRYLVIGGEVVPLTSRQTLLLERYRRLPAEVAPGPATRR
jgi:imidazolonepropionase-like amidohydrolase